MLRKNKSSANGKTISAEEDPNLESLNLENDLVASIEKDLEGLQMIGDGVKNIPAYVAPTASLSAAMMVALANTLDALMARHTEVSKVIDDLSNHQNEIDQNISALQAALKTFDKST